MAFVITDACGGVKDTACVDVCPVDAIHPGPNDPRFAAASQLYIDPQTCIDCGLCVEECPVRAVHHPADLPPGDEKFIQINADWFNGRAP